MKYFNAPIRLIQLSLLFLAVLTCAGCHSFVEKKFNQCDNMTPPKVSNEIQKLHSGLIIADMHADTLLWKRNILERYDYGHLDLPRAIDANLAFQVFGVVTKTPKNQNMQSNDSDTDQIKLAAILQGWPMRCWNSLLERALYQAKKLNEYAEASQGRFMMVNNQDDLSYLLEQRDAGNKLIGGFCGLEGIHALEGNLNNIDKLYDVGFRMIGLLHFFYNKAGGSAHGLVKGGLTEFGIELVKAVQKKGMVLDLVHSSPKVIDDVLKISTAPVVSSHTGVKGTCDSIRNLSDEQIKGIASTGGIIGIALFEKALCGSSVEDTAKAMRYTADLVGVDHVGLGSDFDGAVKTSIDVTGLPTLTEALVKQGFSSEEIRKIMGGNLIRVLKETLKKRAIKL